MRGRAIALGFLSALLVFCLTCAAGVSRGTPGQPDAVTAVNARSAIDQAENVHSTACQAAVDAHMKGELSDAKYARITTVCDALALAENTANGALASYLATGSMGALQAMNAALGALAAQQAALVAAKEGT